LPSLDDQISIRIETLSLARSLEARAAGRELSVSFLLLGAELATSPAPPPLRNPHSLNQLFAVPVDSTRPATQKELARVLQSDTRADADVRISL